MSSWRLTVAAVAALATVTPVVTPAPARGANGVIAVELWSEDCDSSLDCLRSRDGVVLVAPNGSAARRVPFRGAFDPHFSHDGRFLAVQVTDRGVAVGRVAAQRMQFVDRTRGWASYDGMGWSPRVRQLIFARTRERDGVPSSQLLRVSAPSGRRRSLGSGSAPLWSPNGRWIAFEDDVDDVSQVMVVRPDGRSRRVLTHGEEGATLERWSHDGRKVLFQRDLRWYSVNVATGTVTRAVVKGPRPREGVRSPDGRLRAIARERGVFVVRAGGSHPRRILGPPRAWGADGYTVADWQRVP